MTDPLPDLVLDHLAVEVADLDAAIRAYVDLFGYHQATQPVVNTRHRVEVVFLEKAGSLPIKLFRPLGGARPVPTKLHHVAFRTRALDAAIAALQARGARVLASPAPGEAFDDEPIAFLYAGGINVELVATDKRRGRLPPPAS